MTRSILSLLAVLVLLSLASPSQSAPATKADRDLLARANALYKAGKKEAAKTLYRKCDLPEAHFALAYQYTLSDKEDRFHLVKAAEAGHGKALYYAMDNLLYRAGSLTKADPKQALALYRKAKAANPNIEIYSEEVLLKTLKRCNEPKPFNVAAFLKKYKIDAKKLDETFYGVWLLAEEAARGDGRFGKPDPELIFNLVMRGGQVPAELSSAVFDAHKAWKEGKVLKFKIDNYVTSGTGAAFVSYRRAEAEKKVFAAQCATLSKAAASDTDAAIKTAFAEAVKFIDHKTRNEEGHGGSWRATWCRGSQSRQKNAYLKLLRKIRKGFAPAPAPLTKADRALNATYKLTYAALKKKPIETGMAYSINAKGLLETQRQWLRYRDTSAALFARLNPAVSQSVWKAWLTETRTQQLKGIHEQVKEHVPYEPDPPANP